MRLSGSTRPSGRSTTARFWNRDLAGAACALISDSSIARLAVPPMWNVRIVSCVPGSPIDCAAMMPTARPRLDRARARQVHAVALRADAEARFARERRADADLLVAERLDAARRVLGDDLVLADDDLVGDDVDDRVAGGAAPDRLREGHLDLVALVDHRLGDAVERAAVVLAHDDVLRDVRQLARQVAGVGRLERRVGEALARAVGRAEVLEHLQAFAEVGLDGRLDDLARGLGHEAAHAAELAHLVDRATGARLDHAVDRVDVELAVALVAAQRVHHAGADPLAGGGPAVDDLEVALALGDDALAQVGLDLVDLLLGLVEDAALLGRHLRMSFLPNDRPARVGRLEAQVLEVVEQAERRVPAEQLVAVADDAADGLLREAVVVERHPVREDVVEEHAADGRVDAGQGLPLARRAGDDRALAELERHLVVDAELARRVGEEHLVAVGARRDALLLRVVVDGQVVDAEDHVLRRRDDRRAVGGREHVVRRQHQGRGLDLRLEGERQVDGHLVAVEVGVEAACRRGGGSGSRCPR